MEHINMKNPVVETIKLTKIFKDFWGRDKVVAVDNLDLQIYSGEVFGLLGPNGSGKTTTIKILLGLLYPTRGRAYVFGKSPQNVEIKSRIGYLPEETRLYQFLDSWETLDFYGALFDLDRAERLRRTDALIEMVGLGPAAYRPVGQYSKGMARRIGLAQALINDPDLIIFDEPTSGMDPIGTKQIKDLILELKKRGKTILLSSHLLADVEDVCDRIGIMYGGKLLCCGTIDELLTEEDVTQLLTEKLNENDLKELTQILQEKLGKSVISVKPPKKKLEDFFLTQVEEAQKKLTTSGAIVGGKVSEFLRAKEEDAGKSLLEKLVTAEPEPTTVESKSEKPQPRQNEVEARKTLEKLLENKETEKPPQHTQPQEVKPQKEVKREILEHLVEEGGESNASSEDAEQTEK